MSLCENINEHVILSISKLPLTNLYVAFCDISDQSMTAICKITSLHTLDISGNNEISLNGLNNLTSLSNLKCRITGRSDTFYLAPVRAYGGRFTQLWQYINGDLYQLGQERHLPYSHYFPVGGLLTFPDYKDFPKQDMIRLVSLLTHRLSVVELLI